MRTPSCVRSVAGVAAFTIMSTFGAFALCLLGTGQAFAIPSPELVVGSFVSLSQLFALASAVLGGGAAFATLRAQMAFAKADGCDEGQGYLFAKPMPEGEVAEFLAKCERVAAAA